MEAVSLKSMRHCLILLFFVASMARGASPIVGWGNNFSGQTNARASEIDVAAIATGKNHNVLRRRDGTVFVWGANFFGQTNMPGNLSNVTAIAAGSDHTLVLFR